MPKDYYGHDKEPPPPEPQPRRDYIPADKEVRGVGARRLGDWVPEFGPLPTLPEPPETTLHAEPKEAPLLDHDFIPGIPLQEEVEPEVSGPPRLAVGTQVGKIDGKPLFVLGYDAAGVPRIGDAAAFAAGEAGEKGGEAGEPVVVDAREFAAAEPEPEKPKRSHKATQKRPNGSADDA